MPMGSSHRPAEQQRTKTLTYYMYINGAHVAMNEITADQMSKWLTECRAAFPSEKKYQVIYADPPWSYSTSSAKISNSTDTHYPVMSLEELKALPVREIAEKHAALFLWTSNPILPKAIALMEAWGFEYKTVFKCWRKCNKNGSPVCVPGWWSRSSTELLLVGAKGSPLKNKAVLNEPQEFSSERESHSEKPDEIRDAIFNFLNVERRIELFARKISDGWECWGLETPGFFYEGGGESGTAFHTHDGKKFRSFGVQVDTLLNVQGKMKKTNRKGIGGGLKTHKPDCKCCVCKGRRAKAATE